MSISLQVLFIEDSEADMQIVLQVLRDHGYVPRYQRVESAVMLQLALQQQSWDLVICDYLMPNFSAPEALRILQTTRLDLPFIVLSGMIGEDLAVEMMRAGASDYLFKGQIKRLVPAIARELKDADSRRAKRQAEVSAARLAAIVESSEDAIISTDVQGAVLTWNSGAEKLYGYSAAEVMGKPLTQVIQPYLAHSQSTQAQNGPTVDYNRIIDCRQVTQQRKTGELIDVLLTISLIKDAIGTVEGFAIIARDISERQKLQRMKDEFISIVNHELRTPLTSLQGSIELLLTGKLGDLSNQGQRMLEIAANNIDRIVTLTSNILDLEGLSTGAITMQKRPCDINRLLNHVVEQSQAMTDRRGIQLLVVPPTQSIQLSLDSDRITQVLNQLILNAVQASRSGNRIWLIAELQTKELPTNRNSRLPHLVISIKDEGRGIPADKLETIFGQFQQVDASDSRHQGGAGLGLAICRSIIQQHQGTLWVESILGQGSTFYLALPTQRVAVQA